LPDLTFQILSYFSPADLANYAKVSHTSQAESIQFSQVAYSVSQVLSRFFNADEITQFRVIQALTGLLISGSIALQFLQRESYPGSDLDLYVEHCFARIVGHFLMSLQYVFHPRTAQDSNFDIAITSIRLSGVEANPLHQYPAFHIAGVYDFTKGNDQRIQLITAVFSPLDIILNFHSTVVMNIISHSHAYSLYPYATFEENISLICSTNEGPDRDQSLQKYIDRGWTMIDGLGELWGQYTDDQPASMFQIGEERRLGDQYTWTLPLTP
ncbi:hypothetical protein GYMLUDRAFT_135532, partial [Collybiopsis luxurians FD-317 M1]